MLTVERWPVGCPTNYFTDYDRIGTVFDIVTHTITASNLPHFQIVFWSLGLWCHRDYLLRLLSVELAQTLREAQQELGLLNGLNPTRKSEQEWMDNWVWLWVVISPFVGVQERGKVGTPWANGLCSSQVKHPSFPNLYNFKRDWPTCLQWYDSNLQSA